jgi:hypothetical protein
MNRERIVASVEDDADEAATVITRARTTPTPGEDAEEIATVW